MTPQQLLTHFQRLHEKAREGTLTNHEVADYDRARSELAELIVSAQQSSAVTGSARATLRVACMTKVDVVFIGTTQNASTLDLGEGGFSALLHPSPPVHATISFRLHLKEGDVTGHAKCVDQQKHGGIMRASFAFTDIPEKERELLAMMVFDHVLSRTGGLKK